MINKKMKIITGIIAIIAIFGLFVIADYFALFGTEKTLKIEFVEVRLRTLNAETGSLVFDVGVRCFQKGNMNACTRRESHQAGVVAVHIPVRRVIESTLLFDKSEEIIRTADPKMQIMLLHQNYNNPIKAILLDEIYAHSGIEYTVAMPPRKWDAPEVETDE